MEDLMIILYLKDKGMYNLSESEFKDRFKDVMIHHYMKDYEYKDTLNKDLFRTEENKMNKTIVSEEKAKHVVSKMYHYNNGNKCEGEVFSMSKAAEVFSAYSRCLPNETLVTEIYIAINALYHDYEELFKSWFGCNIDNLIIESAIIFWFKDDDWCNKSKVVSYFNL